MLEDENKTTTTELTDEAGDKVVVTTQENEEKVPVEEEEDKSVVINQEEEDDDTAGIVVIPPKNNKKRNGIIIGVVTGVVIVVLVLVLCLTLIKCEDDTECLEGDETCLVEEDLTEGVETLPEQDLDEDSSSSETFGDEDDDDGDEDDEEESVVTLSNYTLSFTFKYAGASETCPDYASLYIVGSWDNWSTFNKLEEGENNTYTYTFTEIEVVSTAYEYLVLLSYSEDDDDVSYDYKTTSNNQTFIVSQEEGNDYTNDIEITLTSSLATIIPSPTIPDKTNVTVTFKITYNEESESALEYASLRITGTFNSWSSWYECEVDGDGNYYYTFDTLSVRTYTYCAVLYYTGEEYDGDPYDYKVNGADASFEVDSSLTDDYGTIEASLEAVDTLSNILPEKVYYYEDEDTTDYPVITVYDSLNKYTYYNGDRVVIEGASVIGRHGKVLTIQQTYSSSYYQVEVWCLSIPDDVSLGKKINVIGTVSVEYGRRVVLEDARVEYVSSGSIGYASKIRYIQNDPYTYFYYSGQIVKHQFRVLYEVNENSTRSEDQEVLTVPNLYRAFRVEYRNWYKSSSGSYSTGTDRGYTYIVLYDDLTTETKTYYDCFFDGVDETTTVGSTIFSSSWKGVVPDSPITEEGYEYDPSDYHWFEVYAKYQYYEGNFYFNFDEFERSYINSSNYTSYSSVIEGSKEDVSGVLSGLFNSGDELTLTGVLMEQHGSTITIQEYSASSNKGTGLCLEVELDESEDPNLKTAYALLITVTGKVEVHQSETLMDYTHTLTEAKINYEAQLNDDDTESGRTEFDILYHYSESKTRTYYGTSSISSVSNNIYGEYSASYMHAGVEIVYCPESWGEDEDYWFIGRLRYKSGSITYVLSEYIPVVIYKDEQEEELKFFKAMVNGVDEDDSSVTLAKAAYRTENSKLTIGLSSAPTIEGGYTGLKVGDILMSNFMHLHYLDDSVSEAFNKLNEEYPFSDDRYLSIDFNSGMDFTVYPW